MDRGAYRLKETNPTSSSSSLDAAPFSSPSLMMSVNFIEHNVTKMDTLAGVAIKYGVEVADIRRLNGLVTDLQMFAHKSLQIPLPGRHPPSPILSNGSTKNGYHSIGECRKLTPPHRPLNDVLDSFQSLKLNPPQGKVSPAMSSLQGYYSLTTPKAPSTAEGTEMSVYTTGRALDFEEEEITRELVSHHRKSRNLVNGFLPEDDETTDLKAVCETADSADADRSIRRRQKSDTDSSVRTSESILKEEMNGGLLGRTGKNLAPRPKSGSRTDMDIVRVNALLIGDPLTNGLASVRKSSSTANLLESDDSSSIWPSSRWTLKPEFIAKEIFDGFQKPMNIRRNKASLD